MQKIDFVKNLETIVEKLKSVEIFNYFEKGFDQPNMNYNYSDIIPLLFFSKSNYDLIKGDGRYSEILTALHAHRIYEEANLSHLTTILRVSSAIPIIGAANAIALFNFHSTLIKTASLSKNILQGQRITDSLNNEVDNGLIVFQIVIDGEGLEIEQYIKIFTAMNELITNISKIVNEQDQRSEIIILDSGSDTNVGIKTGIETAKLLFSIFKEIWDYITNFRRYKQKQNNQTFLESLSIRTEIQKKIKEGILSEEEGREYTFLIKTRTDDLMGMKVMPKQIVIERSYVENKKLLSEFEGMKMLSSNEQNDINNS